MQIRVLNNDTGKFPVPNGRLKPVRVPERECSVNLQYTGLGAPVSTHVLTGTFRTDSCLPYQGT